MPEEALKARISQADQHQDENSADMKALIKQGDENNPNPNLEVLINQNDENSNNIVKAIKNEKTKPTDQMMEFLSGFFTQMKGEKGETGPEGKQGKQGEKGEKGNQGITGFKGSQGEKGDQGEKGEPGEDGKDGKDAKVNIPDIIKMVLERISKPKDGKDAEFNINDVVKNVIVKIKELKDDDRISYNNLKETPQMYRSGREGFVGGDSNPSGGGATFVDDETPDGLINGTNKEFTLSKVPVAGSLKVYVNGQRMDNAEDYILSNKTITLSIAPPTGSVLRVDYRE